MIGIRERKVIQIWLLTHGQFAYCSELNIMWTICVSNLIHTCESRPTVKSMMKKRTDQSWGIGSWDSASGYTINAIPGPAINKTQIINSSKFFNVLFLNPTSRIHKLRNDSSQRNLFQKSDIWYVTFQLIYFILLEHNVQLYYIYIYIRH